MTAPDDAAVLCEHLRTAKRPEDVFGLIADGPLPGRVRAIKHVFNSFVVLIHPDRNPDMADAGKYVAKLTALRAEAERLLKDGTYGKPRKPTILAILSSRTGIYQVRDQYRVGEIADLFIAESRSLMNAGHKCLLKIVREPRDNDLLDIEARVLTDLHGRIGVKAGVFQKYLPKLIDSFAMIKDGRHRKVNVLDIADGCYSYAEIREAYPDGIDSRDAAWMLRRAFEVLGWVHSCGYVHGAVLPEHMLVHPTGHEARLVGWSYAVRAGMRLTAISALRKGWYPSSVLHRQPATPALDVKFVGECAHFLMADRNRKLRADVPVAIAEFFTNCRVGKIEDGWTAYKLYDEVLKKQYGKRAYRPFAMPPK